MKDIFKIGDEKTYTITVAEEDIAAFKDGIVHRVYSTFALSRDAEWAGRLFVLEMKEEDEEGIGTMLSIHHISPAFIGQEVNIVARIASLDKNEIICEFTASVGSRMIALGKSAQKILKREKIERIFRDLH